MVPDNPAADSSHSITLLLAQLKENNSEAAREIWQRFFERLLPLARARLRTVSDRSRDEEDVLVSVFDRFFRAARERRFAKLEDRDDLWQILLLLTERKVVEHYRKSQAQKRGGGKVYPLGELTDKPHELREMIDQDLGPEFLIAFNDNLAHALARLSDDRVREVALLKLEGYQNREIAERLHVSLSSVERKLSLVRQTWEQDFGAPDS